MTNPTSYETVYTYDLNGNMNSLTRKDRSGNLIDNLTYSYQTSNQLDYIVDASSNSQGVDDQNTGSSDFLYDDNGNMIWDKNKAIKLEYNHLNLPEKIYEDNGTGDELSYIYDAAGTKWIKKIDQSGAIARIMYAGSFIYEDTTDNLSDQFVLDYILNPEEKIDLATATPEYQYHMKDHLGNTRVVFNGEGTAAQETDYYPFGMNSRMTTLSGDNKYLYNGKELQDEKLGGINLDWYDSRNIIRWGRNKSGD